MSWLTKLARKPFMLLEPGQPYWDDLKLLTAKPAAAESRRTPLGSDFREVEYSVFSQFGDDGIIQHLVRNLGLTVRSFVEFGVENYLESNTRYLMMNDNWSGLVFDASAANVAEITSAPYYWKHDLVAREAFIDRDNINDLVRDAGFEGEIGLLHIDLDGMDYWIWRALDIVNPVIVIMEYNAVFGPARAITVPYDARFSRFEAHYSGLYFGASLPALESLAREKGYAFVGANSAGNNAYFVRDDYLVNGLRPRDVREGFVESRYRESRNGKGELTYLSGQERMREIAGLPVIEVIGGELETL